MAILRGRHGGTLWRARLACSGQSGDVWLPPDILRRALGLFLAVPIRMFPELDHGGLGSPSRRMLSLSHLAGTVQVAWWNAEVAAIDGVIEIVDEAAERRVATFHDVFTSAPLSPVIELRGVYAGSREAGLYAGIEAVWAVDLVMVGATQAKVLGPVRAESELEGMTDMVKLRSYSEDALRDEIESLHATEQKFETEIVELRKALPEIEEAAGEAMLAESMGGEPAEAAIERAATARSRLATLDQAVRAARRTRVAAITQLNQAEARAFEAAAAKLEGAAAEHDQIVRSRLAEIDELTGFDGGWIVRWKQVSAIWRESPHLAIMDYHDPQQAPFMLRLLAEAYELRKRAERRRGSDVLHPRTGSRVVAEGYDLEAIIEQVTGDPLQLAPRPDDIRAFAEEQRQGLGRYVPTNANSATAIWHKIRGIGGEIDGAGSSVKPGSHSPIGRKRPEDEVERNRASQGTPAAQAARAKGASGHDPALDGYEPMAPSGIFKDHKIG